MSYFADNVDESEKWFMQLIVVSRALITTSNKTHSLASCMLDSSTIICAS